LLRHVGNRQTSCNWEIFSSIPWNIAFHQIESAALWWTFGGVNLIFEHMIVSFAMPWRWDREHRALGKMIEKHDAE
jgi:hypothetical protein